MLTTIGQLFSIEYGQKEFHNKEWLDGENGDKILVSSKGEDNGLYGFFDIKNNYEAPIITVPSTGTVGHAFIQNEDCSVDDNCLVLKPKEKLSIEQLYQVAFQIRANKWKYRYGRQITPTRLEKQKVKIIESKIDYEKFSKKNMPKEITKEKITPPKKHKLVKLTELCEIERKYYAYLNEVDRTAEKYPYVTTTEYDNGISIFCNEEPIFKKGSLTVSLDGSCGITFYQFKDFIAGEKTAVLTLKNKDNPLLLAYIGVIIRLQAWKYHYGRKLSIARLNEIEIPMPITDDGKYDLAYIKKLFTNSYSFKELEI